MMVNLPMIRGDWQWAVSDGLNSLRVVYDEALNPFYSADYLPHGEVHNKIGSTTLPQRFTGQELDANGIQYHRARYYDPSLGAWLSRDPLETVNRYAYVNGDPVNFADMTGLVTCSNTCNSEAPFAQYVSPLTASP